MAELMSVSDFAAHVGLSRQAVYKRLSTDLKPFLNLVDNRKYIDAEALCIFGLQDLSTNCQLDDNLDILKSTVEMLQRELQIKNQQIERLNDALEKCLSLTNQGQTLLAVEKMGRERARVVSAKKGDTIGRKPKTTRVKNFFVGVSGLRRRRPTDFRSDKRGADR